MRHRVIRWLVTALLVAGGPATALANKDQERHRDHESGATVADRTAPHLLLDRVPLVTSDGRYDVACILLLSDNKGLASPVGEDAVKRHELRSDLARHLPIIGELFSDDYDGRDFRR
jgi:hypothetical protein